MTESKRKFKPESLVVGSSTALTGPKPKFKPEAVVVGSSTAAKSILPSQSYEESFEDPATESLLPDSLDELDPVPNDSIESGYFFFGEQVF